METTPGFHSDRTVRQMNTENPAQNGLEFLPHGPEFRFLDKVSSLTPGKEGKGEYRVRGDEPFLRAHFPGDPIFPGVLLVEAAAQLAGVVAQSDPLTPALKGLKLAALRGVKISGARPPRGCGAARSPRHRTAGQFGPEVFYGELGLLLPLVGETDEVQG